MIWGNGQFYMAPRVDHIHDLGVSHWVALGEEHGFVGPHVQCDGLPLDQQGLRALVRRSTFSWIWVWPDANWGTVPDGGLMGAEALRYYDVLLRILEPVKDTFGLSVGSDPAEWVSSVEVDDWVSLMQMHYGEQLLVGARSHVVTAWPGTYAGWGDHFDDKSPAAVRALITDQLGRVAGREHHLCGEDRVRERTPLRTKDATQPQQLRMMPVFVDEEVGSIWGVLGDETDGRHELGTLPWDDPAAVKAALSGAPVPPPNGRTCSEVADVLAAEAARHSDALAAIEDDTRTCCGSSPPPPPPLEPGGDLEGITVIGVTAGWDITTYAITCTITSVELSTDLEVRWPDQGWDEADIGPFPPSNPHHGRLYLVNYRTRKMWGIEWLRRPGESDRTTVHPWTEDGLDIIQTLIAKAKGDSGADIRADDQLGVVIAAPHLRERSSVLMLTA